MRKKKTWDGTTVVLVVLFFAGLSLLLYPTVSNYWNSLHQSYAIAGYTQEVADLDGERYAQVWQAAQDYNRGLLDRSDAYRLPEELTQEYERQLDVTGTGIMGYVEIPCIDCTLPIYHGTDDAVLQVAVGHLEWSSLPVGGPDTHSVISGHRGLPSAELLTHIDRLALGDAFYIHVLDKTLEYRVDDIAVVEPEDTARLRVVAGEDYVTLVTCTPYGINSHRLLVRGTRVGEGGLSTSGKTLYLTDEVESIHPIYLIPVGLAVLAAVFVWVLLPGRSGPARGKRELKQKEKHVHDKAGQTAE